MLVSGRVTREGGSFQSLIHSHIVSPFLRARYAIGGFASRTTQSFVDAYHAQLDKAVLEGQMQIDIPMFDNTTTLVSGAFTNPYSKIVKHSRLIEDPIGLRIHVDMKEDLGKEITIGVAEDRAFIQSLGLDGSYSQLNYQRGEVQGGVRQPGIFWYERDGRRSQLLPSLTPYLYRIFFRDIDRIIKSKGFYALPFNTYKDAYAFHATSPHPSRAASSPRQHSQTHGRYSSDETSHFRPGDTPVGINFNHGTPIPVDPNSPVGQQLYPVIENALLDSGLPDPSVVPTPDPNHQLQQRRTTPSIYTGEGNTDTPSPYTNTRPWSLNVKDLVDDDTLKGALESLSRRYAKVTKPLN